MSDIKDFRVLESSITNALNLEELSEEDAAIKVAELFDKVRTDCKNSSIKSYKEGAAKILADIREDDRGFDKRIFSRWQPAFDHLEMIWHVAHELGEAHGKDVQERNEADNNKTMAALANIFPKALLVTQEIICLLKGGFPDGALSRWRSLHELSVTAQYIAKHGEKAAIEYLLSFHFSSRRAAFQMNEYSERSGIKRFSEDELREFDTRCEEAERILERNIKNDRDGEWPKISGKNDFSSIERDVGMDHWRPWYKWASSYIHANHRPAEKSLGLSEIEAPVSLVRASNSGFVDPFQMTALTLSQLVETYLGHSVNLDRIIHIEVVQELAHAMGNIAIETEMTSREDFKQSE